MRRGVFHKTMFGLGLLLGTSNDAFSAAANPCIDHFQSVLRMILAPARPQFDSGLFQRTLDELSAHESGLGGFRLEQFKTPEEKLALFEVLTQRGDHPSPLDLAKLLENADEEILARIRSIIDNVKNNPNTGVSVRLSRNAIQDLYLLAHPVPKKSFLQSLLPPTRLEANELIRKRCEMDLASLNAEQALNHLGWSDRRKLEQLRLWLHTHSNLRNTLVSGAVDSIPLGGVKILEHATQMTLGNPGLSNFFVRFPKLKFYWPNGELLQKLQSVGVAGLEGELVPADRMRAMGELYYDYIKTKVGPAMSLYLMNYVYQHWSDEKNIVGVVKLLASTVSLNAKNLQEVQDRDRGTGKAQFEQAKSSLEAELSADPHPSPERLWSVVKSNLNLPDDQIFTDYTGKSSQSAKSAVGSRVVTAKEIARTTAELLTNVDHASASTQEFSRWANERISIEDQLAQRLNKRSIILPEELWNLSEKLLQSRKSSLITASPKNVSAIAEETLDRFEPTPTIAEMKRWLKKKEIVSRL